MSLHRGLTRAEQAHELAAYLIVSEKKVEELMSNSTADRIKALTDQMLEKRMQEAFKGAVEEASRIAQDASTTALEIQQQNKKLVLLLQECVDFVVATSTENGDTLPDCIEAALILLTERALLRKKAEQRDPP